MPLLTNPLASPEQLSSRLSNNTFPPDVLDAIFVATQCLTQAAGILLEIPQSTTAQANVVLARYWVSEPPGAFEFSDLSAAALYVVSKDGPLPRSPRDLCNVYTYLCSSSSSFFRSQPPKGSPETYSPSEGAYAAFHSRLMEAEAGILYSLGYDTTVALPHPLAITYLQALDFAGKPRKEITSRVVAYLNTALLSPQTLYLTHQPGELATAAIFLAARDVGAKMPAEPWWELFDVDREQLGFLACSLNSVESLMRKQRDEFAFLADGMVTRKKQPHLQPPSYVLCRVGEAFDLPTEEEFPSALEETMWDFVHGTCFSPGTPEPVDDAVDIALEWAVIYFKHVIHDSANATPKPRFSDRAWERILNPRRPPPRFIIDRVRPAQGPPQAMLNVGAAIAVYRATISARRGSTLWHRLKQLDVVGSACVEYLIRRGWRRRGHL